MTIVYPINGKNERMGNLFRIPKHLLLLDGKPLLVRSIETMLQEFPTSQVIIATNDEYCEGIRQVVEPYPAVQIRVIGRTNSQVETIRSVTENLTGPVMFVDCDIVPQTLTTFNKKYITVFTFKNTNKLLSYSNFKANSSKTILECNEKQKPYKNAGAGIYYFPDVSDFNQNSFDRKSVSECISHLIQAGTKAKINLDSTIGRYGTLQDIFVDTFSFRQTRSKDLSTGFTDNKVLKHKHVVIKTGSTTFSEGEWYSYYKNKKQIPNVISYTDNTIVMDYINRSADVQLDDVLELIEEYKAYDRLNDYTFDSYIDNISNHLRKNNNITNGKVLLDYLSRINVQPTFCHGDLSIMNIIPTKVGLKLIDPLYSKDKFGSYEIDIAKLCFSFKFYKNDSASFNYLKDKAGIAYLDILVAAEAVRVSSYKKEYSFIAENLINELLL